MLAQNFIEAAERGHSDSLLLQLAAAITKATRDSFYGSASIPLNKTYCILSLYVSRLIHLILTTRNGKPMLLSLKLM